MESGGGERGQARPPDDIIPTQPETAEMAAMHSDRGRDRNLI